MSAKLSPAEILKIARNSARPNAKDFIAALFTDFFEQKGDRACRDDESILGGIAMFHGTPVTVIAQHKGKDLNENLKYNFGMPSPEGYRKSMRLMAQAEKFSRPVITLIDTPGAYPGLEAEARGQGEAIAQSLKMMSALTVPVVSVITGEGCSGGALAISVGNSVLMLENAVYSILSPEGFASILWKDPARSDDACTLMRMTSDELLKMKIIDEIVPEPPGGAHENPAQVFINLDRAVVTQLRKYQKWNGAAIAGHRYKKFRAMGNMTPSVRKETP